MPVLAMLRMTTAERAAAQVHDNQDHLLGGRQIENPLANSLGDGIIVGDWIVAARILNDPDYEDYYGDLIGCPIRVYDSETLFFPDVD